MFEIQGENSMKSRRNSQSILLQLLRNQVYTQGDRDELEIFLEIRLIPSRIDQKLKNKGRNTLVLKGKLARGSWPIEAFVAVDSWLRGSGYLG